MVRDAGRHPIGRVHLEAGVYGHLDHPFNQEDLKMKRISNMALSALLATGATTALAQAPQAPKPAAATKPTTEHPAPNAPLQPPPPAPENDIIKKSVGTWTCEGSVKGPDGTEHKFKSGWTVKSILGGHWYSVVYKRAKMGPMPAFQGNATVGYNTAEKKYWFVGVDDMGGWMSLTSADGASYSGEASVMGQKTPTKFTFSPGKDNKDKETDKAFSVTMDFGVATSLETCKK